MYWLKFNLFNISTSFVDILYFNFWSSAYVMITAKWLSFFWTYLKTHYSDALFYVSHYKTYLIVLSCDENRFLFNVEYNNITLLLISWVDSRVALKLVFCLLSLPWLGKKSMDFCRFHRQILTNASCWCTTCFINGY